MTWQPQRSVKALIPLICEYVRQKSKTDYWQFDAWFFRAPLPTPPFHREMVELWDEPNEFAAIAAPRGHAKTTRMTVRHHIWRLLHHNEYTLLISKTWEQSVNHLRAIRFHVEHNATLRDYYDLSIAQDNKDDLIVESCLGRKRVMARGTGQSLRGIIDEQERRPSLIICDDLEDDQRVKNERLRREDMEWFWSVLIPARAKGGQVRVVGTILHKDALLKRLLSEWPSLCYDAEAGEGGSLWPEHMTLAELKTLEAQFTELGQKHKYYCEYRNNPIDPDDTELKTEWIQYHTPSAEDLDQLMITTTVDPAFALHDRADRTAIVTCAWTRSRPSHMWILDARRGRWSPLEAFDQLYALNERYKIGTVYLEDVQAQKLLQEILLRELQRRRAEALASGKPPKTFRVETVKPGRRAKVERIRMLTVPLARGQIWWAGEFPELREEYEAFPWGSSDDLLDALAYQIEVNGISAEVAPPQPKKEEGGYLIDLVMDRAKLAKRRVNRHE